MTMFKLSPSEVRQEVINCMEVQLVPLVSGSPGVGKSAIMRGIAEEFNLELIDLRLSQCAPEDLMGLPMRSADGKRSEFLPFDTFPLEGDELPAGKQGWLLFLDELPSATKMVQAAAYKVALDRMVGQAKLHPNCFVVGAGNLATDKAIVNQLSTAMQSRLVHLEMEVSHKDFMQNAIKDNYDPRVIGFLEYMPEHLWNFNPDHHDRTFACPRTWEFASRLIKNKPLKKISKALMAGTISEGTAVEFHTFMGEYEHMPTLAEIIKDPTSADLPPKTSTRFAVASMLMMKTTKKNLKEVSIYMRRMSPEFQVVFYKGLLRRDPTFRREQAYAENISHLTTFLTDDDESAAA